MNHLAPEPQLSPSLATQTTTTARFAGKMVADPQEDPEGDAILSIELAIPGDQRKTAELKARDICLGCTCDADCPEICCEGQVSQVCNG